MYKQLITVVCVRGRQVHAEWGWLSAGEAAELDWWLDDAYAGPAQWLLKHTSSRKQRRNRYFCAGAHTSPTHSIHLQN